MRVAIAGSTGEVGKQVLRFLLKDERITEVYALVRRPLLIEHPKLKELIVNFGSLETLEYVPLDMAIGCLGSTMKKAGSKEAFRKIDHGYTLAFARWALASGAYGFHLVSGLGANLDSPVFYNKVKGETEQDITKLRFKESVFYRPSLLDSEREEKRIGERIGVLGMRLINPLLLGSLEVYRSIKVEKVAEGIVSRLGTINTHSVILSNEI